MTVVPFTLVYPGFLLATLDRDDAHKAMPLFYVLDRAVMHAALALGGFIDARAARRIDTPPARLDWAPDFTGRPRTLQEQDAMRVEDERRAVLAAFQRGELPRGYAHQLPFFYAHAFLFAMHTARSALAQFAGMALTRDAAGRALAELDRVQPDLTGVRNSAAHVDERVQGLGAGGRKIEPLPVDRLGIHAPKGGAFVVSGLFGDHYTDTMADGRLGAVAVTLDAFNQTVAAVQAFIAALPWEPGGGRVVPSSL